MWPRYGNHGKFLLTQKGAQLVYQPKLVLGTPGLCLHPGIQELCQIQEDLQTVWMWAFRDSVAPSSICARLLPRAGSDLTNWISSLSGWSFLFWALLHPLTSSKHRYGCIRAAPRLQRSLLNPLAHLQYYHPSLLQVHLIFSKCSTGSIYTLKSVNAAHIVCISLLNYWSLSHHVSLREKPSFHGLFPEPLLVLVLSAFSLFSYQECFSELTCAVALSNQGGGCSQLLGKKKKKIPKAQKRMQPCK